MARATSTITSPRARLSGQDYFPHGMERARLYAPTGRGQERELRHRVQWLDDQRAKRRSQKRSGGGHDPAI